MFVKEKYSEWKLEKNSIEGFILADYLYVLTQKYYNWAYSSFTRIQFSADNSVLVDRSWFSSKNIMAYREE